jgi:hypothetical protein
MATNKLQLMAGCGSPPHRETCRPVAELCCWPSCQLWWMQTTGLCRHQWQATATEWMCNADGAMPMEQNCPPGCWCLLLCGCLLYCSFTLQGRG